MKTLAVLLMLCAPVLAGLNGGGGLNNPVAGGSGSTAAGIAAVAAVSPSSASITASGVSADKVSFGYSSGVTAVAAVSPSSASITASGVSADKVSFGYSSGVTAGFYQGAQGQYAQDASSPVVTQHLTGSMGLPQNAWPGYTGPVTYSNSQRGALLASLIYNAQEGDIIYCSPGTYDLTLWSNSTVFTVSNLTITGVPGQTVLLTGSTAYLEYGGDGSFNQTLTLNGLTITGTAGNATTGAPLIPCFGTLVCNQCALTNNSGAVIYPGGNPNIILISCSLTGGGAKGLIKDNSYSLTSYGSSFSTVGTANVYSFYDNNSVVTQYFYNSSITTSTAGTGYGIYNKHAGSSAVCYGTSFAVFGSTAWDTRNGQAANTAIKAFGCQATGGSPLTSATASNTLIYP